MRWIAVVVLVACGQPAEVPAEVPPVAKEVASPAGVGEARPIPAEEPSKVTVAFDEAVLRDVVTYLAQLTGRELVLEGEPALDAVVTADSGPIPRADVPAWATDWLRAQGLEARFDEARLVVRPRP